MSEGEASGVRFGVYIPPDLARELEEFMSKARVTSKSHIVQEALRLFLAENRWRLSGELVGAIGLIYNHEVGNADAELTDIQHHYLDVILGSFHVHLDEENCLLFIIVKGSSERIRRLLDEVRAVKAVKSARTLLLAY
ncbi:CopG family ribbon-helix-helix protein [Stetteria hydrogenophila]